MLSPVGFVECKLLSSTVVKISEVTLPFDLVHYSPWVCYWHAGLGGSLLYGTIKDI